MGRQYVVCVEARPDAAEAIRENHPTFGLLPYAVGERAGRAPFLVLEDKELRGSSSLNLHRALTHRGDSRVIEVEVMRLDELLPAAFTPIDVMKIDVEGSTLPALFGLGERLRDVRVLHVETETLERAAWGEPANNHAVAYYLRAFGFRLVDVSYQWGPSIEDQTWVNLGALRPSAV